MEKFTSKICGAVTALVAMFCLFSCNPEPKATDVEFSYATFTADEGEENAYISVYLMQSPEKFPVVVDMEVEMTAGRDAEGKELALNDVIEFVETDKTYTATSTGARTATITGVEVTYSTYNQKVYFNVKQNDYLQSETITIEFRLTKVDGSKMGNIQNTTLTIIDDEKAPLVKVGYYKTLYTAPADATREGAGSFWLRLQKVGKYKYVASEWFGLSRPRLLGTYAPENNTISFDGTDYDHLLWQEATADDEKPFEPINAFQNDTIWGNAYDVQGRITQILQMRGAGSNGLGSIVLTTEEIAENAKGVVLSIDAPCGFDIYNYDSDRHIKGSLEGTYDAMERSESMTFSTTNYDDASAAPSTRSGAITPFAFGGWDVK